MTDLALTAAAALAVAAGIVLLARPVMAETIEGDRIHVVDGDTVALPCPPETRGRRGCAERARLLDIDAPEMWHPRCERELARGLDAKARLRALLTGPVEIARHGHDRYGRTLARLTAPAGDVGAALLADGLAVRWRPGPEAWAERARHWCGERWR